MQKSKIFKCSGSLSIFLSLIILPVFLLVSITCESARIISQKAMLSSALHVSSYSMMGNYAQELYEDYGLYGIYSSKEELVSECNEYIKKNLLLYSDYGAHFSSFYRPESAALSVENLHFLTENDGRTFAEQIVNFSKDTIIKDSLSFTISKFQSDTAKINSRGYTTDFQLTEDDNYIEKILENINNSYDTSTIDNTLPSCENSLPDSYRLSEKIKDFITDSLLSLVLREPSSVSNLSINRSNLPSLTVSLSDKAIEEMNIPYINTYTDPDSLVNDNIDKTFFIRYLDYKFSCYSDFEKMEDIPDSIYDNQKLLYELEYIIGGKDNDKANLLQTFTDLITFRAGLNMLYIITDTEKIATAKKIAISSVSHIPIPGITTATTYMILSLWSFAEGIIDCRDLCDGKKVPIYKTYDTWSLSMDNIISLSYNTNSKNTGDTGLSYKDYILIMLMLQNNTSTYMHTMDLIQMNICHRYNNNFALAGCITGFTSRLNTSCTHVFNFIKLFKLNRYYSLSNNFTISY